ncbi:MAG: chromosome segregation protein [Candidatus Nitrosomirales archaeon]|jgi:chromosome segregation protein
MYEMVHIKKVEIYGLKSFGYKNTIVNMEKGMVCITGPNGSGKSNILDAIMFALGENSPKALRVDKLHSLFHDTSEGKVHKLVRASVSFDNTDRGIPIDNNTVTITREMPPEGESEYYLNGRKVTKTTVTDLLEVVRAAPNRLNSVQQGMIMRIAELNAEERRKIIEDIMGLSYFDEKKEEAMKQLGEADRRLEIAMAKMGEIRKRIDELEEERNDQLRFQHLERDIRRFKATKVSNSIKNSRERLEAQKVALEQNLAEAGSIGKELEGVKAELSQLEGEKGKFLQEVDVSSRSKAEVDTRISNTLMRFEQLKAGIAASQQRLKTIGETIPSLIKEKEALKKKMFEINGKINQFNTKIQIKEERKNNVATELDKLNTEISQLINRQSTVTEQQMQLERDLKSSEEIRGNLSLEITSDSMNEKNVAERIEANVKRLNGIILEQNKLQTILAQLERLKREEQQKIDSYDTTMTKFTNNRSKLEQQIESTMLMLEKAGHVATKYETKIKMAKDSNQEDYAITVLLAKTKDFGIVGMFQQLVQWNKEHERAVFAVASAWMKALVVKDVGKMLKVLENAKELQLPRLRIIPLDIAMDQSERNLPAANGVLGFLSSFVTSNKAPNLVDFIFGDTIVMESADAAYELAKQGYKTVTLAGELFEPKANAVVLDLNSKITDLTKTILLGESVDGLKGSLDLLRQLINKKKSELSELANKIKHVESDKVESRTSLTAIDSQIENVQATLQRYVNSVQEIEARITTLKKTQSAITDKLHELELKRTEIDMRVGEINDKLSSTDKLGVSKAIDEANLQKLNVSGTLENIEKEIREEFTAISAQKADLDNLLKRISDIDDELTRIKAEAKDKAAVIKESTLTLNNIETELKEIRDKEQQIIDTSGNSVGILKEYEEKIKILVDSERKLTKQLSNIEKDVALIRKEISDLTASEAKLVVELSEYGYSELLEGYDVDLAVGELTKEYDSIRGSINQLADKSYVQIIDGYRGMSARKNQLESERNSIVRFIEDIEKEKKQIFMEAFQKVDKDVRYIFSTMTAGTGSAWLEIENPDDVFASGLAFLAQFPSKPPRESTGLSGGEKTMAATTFLLALQALKPSPFYLFDEIDAHLDAQNTERLAKVIVEKSKYNQMIVVSLKDAIVANAQLVHGVYPRSGVSQVIKYRANAPMASE